MHTAPQPRRRWYQFSLRTMFVAVFVVSIPLAWVGYSLNWIRQRQAMLASNVIVGYPLGRVSPYGYEVGPQTEAPGSLAIFGEKGQGLIYVLESRVSGYRVKSLFPEAEVVELWEVGQSTARD